MNKSLEQSIKEKGYTLDDILYIYKDQKTLWVFTQIGTKFSISNTYLTVDEIEKYFIQ